MPPFKEDVVAFRVAGVGIALQDQRFFAALSHYLDQLREEEMGTACPALNGCYHFATEFLVTGWIRQHSADYHTAERPCFVDSVVLHGLANTTIAEG